MSTPLSLLVLEGDGIGPEITRATTDVLRHAANKHGILLNLSDAVIGLKSLAQHGTTLLPDIMDRARQVDGVILGPLSTASYPHRTEAGINPSAAFRKQLDLYANIRPSRIRKGVQAHAKAMDLVIVRENTEGFYADRNMFEGGGEFMPTPDIALAVRKITRDGSRRIARAAFDLSRTRRRHVTIVHKANVMHLSDGLFLEAVAEVEKDYPDVETREVIVDAMAALLIRTPEAFDVIVTTNMFGDILSDQASEIAGSLGIAGSVNAGSQFAVAQAAHGSAPDLEGQDVANPIGLISSTALLLSTLAERRAEPALAALAKDIDQHVDRLLEDGDVTPDLGGKSGTRQFAKSLCERLG